MSRQRKKHPEIVEKRKLSREIDKRASTSGYAAGPKGRARQILKMQSGKSKPYQNMPLELMRMFL